MAHGYKRSANRVGSGPLTTHTNTGVTPRTSRKPLFDLFDMVPEDYKLVRTLCQAPGGIVRGLVKSRVRTLVRFYHIPCRHGSNPAK
ncbi:hypothetical protein TRAPUB_4193 [Trametes pubescens]|uniref:Uncharacterized protein n=1 Tax=Trametes pubescens TaxID=154538 RepID=A0A1M2VBH7_TRAPU|nr:hypothetical protein TRAPUB_4193 [Trametes pubescens]